MQLRLCRSLFEALLLEQLRRIALKLCLRFLKDLDLSLQTYLLWNITLGASCLVVLSYFEDEGGGTSESALLAATVRLALDISMPYVKVQWDLLGAGWAGGPREGRFRLYASVDFFATEWI